MSLIRYGANFKVVGKTDPQKLSYPGAFTPTQGTFADLAEHIRRGHPWMPALLEEGEPRWQQYANVADIAALDVDGGFSIQEAIAHPFVAAYCGLGIESASSSPELEKFRLVFCYHPDTKPQDYQEIRICNRFLMEQVKVADKACKDASRFFFGAPERSPFLLNESATLPKNFVDQALSWNQEQERRAEQQAQLAQQRWQQWQAENPERDEKALILEALSFVSPDCEYTEWLSIGMTLFALFGSEGVSIWDRWSAGSSKHKLGECDRKARTFRNVEPRIRQLFNLAKSGGFRFPEWSDPREPFIQDASGTGSGKGFQVKPESDRDRHIQKRLMRFLGYWEELKKDFTMSHADVVYQGYAPTFDAAMTGSILLRGWLGAGKTEATLRSLISLLNLYKNQQIVWVTGRNGLLYNTAERASRFGVSVYHYQDDPANYRELLNRGCPGIFTICPDSLKDYHVSKAVWDKTILVIDEFSGVRRDVLEKSAIMPEFERLLSEASTLIAIDAFLSDVDRRVIEQYRAGSVRVYNQQFQKSSKRIVWLETRNKAGDISFSHDGLPYPLLKQWVSEGKRFAIACDNKLQSKAIRDYLKELGCDGVLCSSETVESNQVLLPDPDRVLKEAIFFVYTPTAQSGLDCQTPFDCGLALYSGVISPIDFLQMIGRCRQCKEWFVSAPRRSLDPNCPVPSLESSRVKDWSQKLAETFTELGSQTGSKSIGWGLWQSLTGGVEKAFHSEYLKCLLQHFFESVEVQEVECNRQQWQQDVKQIKDQEARLKLGANLENGQRLLRQQKAPSNDAEVWDIALAQEYEKYPQVWKELLKQYQSGVDVDEAIALAKLFTSRRLERLKHWVQATGDHAAADLADLQASVRSRFTSYASARWKALQNLSLFQALNLDRLATATGKAISHQTHYRIDSPIISELWVEFERSPKLQRLFPTVETIADFWAILPQCMRAFGYQSANKTIRVETPGRLHPNGRDRQGRQRYSESASLYFCGWVPMASSGSAFFQQNFDLIVEAIRDRLDWERRHRQTEQERSLAPPLAA